MRLSLRSEPGRVSGIVASASLAALLAAACGSSGSEGPESGQGATEPAPSAPTSSGVVTPKPPSGADAGSDGASTGPDSDGDGLSDALEARIANEYFPFFSVHPGDKCSRHGMLLRIAPHPTEPKRVMVWIVALFEKDCGLNGHPGDDETMGVVIDPSLPAPAGILAVRAIAHQNTPCQRITTCGSCAGMTACSTGDHLGAKYPVVYASKDKHGTFSALGTCSNLICDLGGCALAPTASNAPKVNAGEPGKPLVKDLTTEGFINAANGWKEASLLNFDPWKPGDFGSAGDVSNDLVDTAFVIDTTACQ